MTLEEIIQEIDDGGVFIGEYESIKKILENIDKSQITPFSFSHHKAIEFKKIDEDYILNPNYK
ncbi:hypothetical protein G6Z34_13025 [Clostridium perfringens]|uniref:Uncharacterized protein n=1 Tax=Clostridium perfringens TaxID=1502 RepID=A0AAP6WPZ1_CLOPF|nr:hypothetical protein [Clostridium perfringens]NGU31007.1 hypothetical protein [Clostridium perfringens]